MKYKICSLVFLFVLVFVYPSSAQAESSFYRLKSIVHSLDVAQEARDIFYQGYKTYSEEERGAKLNRVIYKSLNKLRRARQDVNRYEKSHSQLTQKSQDLFNKSYDQMEEALTGLQKLINKKSTFEDDDFKARMRRYTWEFQRVGVDLHNAVTLAVYASVDAGKRNEYGHWTHVKMTRQEFRRLSEMVASRFVGSDQVYYDRTEEPVRAALLVIVQFLNGEWKTQGEGRWQEDFKKAPSRVELFNEEQLIKLNDLDSI